MLTLTDSARSAVQALTADAPPDAGVRIAVAPPSGDGQAAPLTMSIAAAPEPDDQVMDEEGARVFLEPSAAQVLGDQTLDAQLVTPEEISFFVR